MASAFNEMSISKAGVFFHWGVAWAFESAGRAEGEDRL